jgi:hypothetical protein
VFPKFGKPSLKPYFLGDIFQKLAQKKPFGGILAPNYFFAFWQNFAHSKTEVVDCTIMILKFKHEKN